MIRPSRYEPKLKMYISVSAEDKGETAEKKTEEIWRSAEEYLNVPKMDIRKPPLRNQRSLGCFVKRQNLPALVFSVESLLPAAAAMKIQINILTGKQEEEKHGYCQWFFIIPPEVTR